MHAWDGYRVLLEVAERGSFSRAAAALGISQPTASRRIDALERELATRLLVRRHRGVIPTPTGERVLVEVRRMGLSATAAARAASGVASELVAPRRIRIAASEGFGTTWLPPRVAALRGDDPRLAIDLVVDNTANDLAARQADLAIRLFRPRQPDLVAKKVGSVRFGFFAAPDYLAAHGTPRRLAELARHDHVGFVERDAGLGIPAYMRWLREVVPPDRFVVGATSLLSMIELARAGCGIAIATVAFVADDPRLVRILPRAVPPAMDIWLAVHADVHRDPDVIAIMGRLATMLRATFAS